MLEPLVPALFPSNVQPFIVAVVVVLLLECAVNSMAPPSPDVELVILSLNNISSKTIQDNVVDVDEFPGVAPTLIAPPPYAFEAPEVKP